MQYDGCSSCLFQMVLFHASCGAGTLPPWTLVRREVAFLLGMEDGRIGTENRQMGDLHKGGVIFLFGWFPLPLSTSVIFADSVKFDCC